MRRTEYPSIGFMLETTGGGSVWEGWGYPDKPTMHCFAQAEGVSSMAAWFYRDLAGLDPCISAPAFGRFILKPHIPSGLGELRYAYESPRGEISSHWKEAGGRVRWDIVVPPNSVAEVHVPADSVEEGGQPAERQSGIKFIGAKDGCQVFELRSGEYHLEFWRRRGISRLDHPPLQLPSLWDTDRRAASYRTG